MGSQRLQKLLIVGTTKSRTKKDLVQVVYLLAEIWKENAKRLDSIPFPNLIVRPKQEEFGVVTDLLFGPTINESTRDTHLHINTRNITTSGDISIDSTSE